MDSPNKYIPNCIIPRNMMMAMDTTRANSTALCPACFLQAGHLRRTAFGTPVPAVSHRLAAGFRLSWRPGQGGTDGAVLAQAVQVWHSGGTLSFAMRATAGRVATPPGWPRCFSCLCIKSSKKVYNCNILILQ
jgi:hypothetical protein